MKTWKTRWERLNDDINLQIKNFKKSDLPKDLINNLETSIKNLQDYCKNLEDALKEKDDYCDWLEGKLENQ